MQAMTRLAEITSFCDNLTRRAEFKDFPGAENGLQVENNGTVTRVGASVDAGLAPFREAVEKGIDFLICHHGLYWNPPQPLIGSNYTKIKVALKGNLAVYSSHLPLDAHPEIGNNALLIKALDLEVDGTFLPYEGNELGFIASCGLPRTELRARIEAQFAGTTAIEFGSDQPAKAAVVTGSGSGAIDALPDGVDTLITGEMRQHHYNLAQERGLNLYLAGHYATETFGVRALAARVAEAFDLPWEFLDSNCPL